MVFLIEGIDGCGKTTVVNNLKKLFPEITYVKESRPGDSYDERVNRLDALRKYINSCEVVVYDRATALDEFIYEPVIGKRPSMLKWEEVEPLLSQCVVIYLSCAVDVISERLEGRGDEYINGSDLSVLREIMFGYDKYIHQIPHVCIDVTNMSEAEECKAVADVLVDTVDLYLKKRPKLAHIVPRDLLYVTVGNQYHMSLAHLIKSDADYRNFYRRMVASGRYVIMDNGAAENAQLDIKDLYECWRAVRPTELVLPDTLYDKDSTLEKARSAIEYFREMGVYSKFMAVPQGKTFEEWKECAKELIQIPDVHCLGVSKFLNIGLHDLDIRYKAVAHIAELQNTYHRDDVEVHLLGCDAGPSEPGKIFKDFNFVVRGCDTALAYIFAQAGVELKPESTRPEGEMSFLENTLESVETLTSAIEQFNNIAGVVNSVGDYTWF